MDLILVSSKYYVLDFFTVFGFKVISIFGMRHILLMLLICNYFGNQHLHLHTIDFKTVLYCTNIKQKFNLHKNNE